MGMRKDELQAKLSMTERRNGRTRSSVPRLSITSNGGPGTIGVANAGFYGVGLRPSTAYTASFYARASRGFSGAVTVSLESTAGESPGSDVA